MADREDVVTPTEASLLTLCAMLAGVATTIDQWTLLAAALDVSREQVAEVRAIADALHAWCRRHGPAR
jgi:hypothetical protein